MLAINVSRPDNMNDMRAGFDVVRSRDDHAFRAAVADLIQFFLQSGTGCRMDRCINAMSAGVQILIG